MLTSSLRAARFVRFGAAAVLAAAAIGASAAPTATKPFKLNGAFQETPGPSPRCPSQFGGTIVGFGDSAVTGKVVFLSSDCITPNGAVYNFSDGKFVILTTNGEQIFANYSGQFVPTGEGTNYVFNGATYQITGGTGKFKKASGGGTLTGGEDMATGQGTLQLNGQITY
ncbi:MAG: hypothetical protein JWP59_333 [Massilia sp.]|nr:hypothetical protein [Massilia sp.]